MKCPKCGAQNNKNNKTCKVCKASLQNVDKDKTIEKIKKETKKELKEELKTETAEKVKRETKKELKKELKDETVEKVKKELQKENAKDIKEKTKNIKEEVKKETTEEIKDEIKKETTNEIKEELKTETAEEIKKELKEELKADLTVEIEDLKADLAKEIIKENKLKPRKRKNIFARIWFTIKFLFFLCLVSLIALVVYVYGYYDYEGYYEDALNRYYETENDQYIDNIKLFFRVYKRDDTKMSKAQKIGGELVNKWVDEIKEKDYYSPLEKKEELDNLTIIIDNLYNNTEVSGHRAIGKKDYNNIKYTINEMLYESGFIQYDEEIEKEEEINNTITNDYDISNMRRLDLERANKLFESSRTSILFIGRETCEPCQNFVNVLNKLASEKNITINYLDIRDIKSTDENYDKFIKNLSFKTTIDDRTETYGEFLGYTPMTIIIKNGKQVDGSIGDLDYEDYLKIVSKYL